MLALRQVHQTGLQAVIVCGFLIIPTASSEKAGGFSHGAGGRSGRKKRPLPAPPASTRGVSRRRSFRACISRGGSVLRPGGAGSALRVPWPPYTICRAAEQNFLINKQDLGFHVGEAMTEEGLGLSPLSAPGPASSSPPGRAERREEGEPGQEHIFRS